MLTRTITQNFVYKVFDKRCLGMVYPEYRFQPVIQNFYLMKLKRVNLSICVPNPTAFHTTNLVICKRKVADSCINCHRKDVWWALSPILSIANFFYLERCTQKSQAQTSNTTHYGQREWPRHWIIIRRTNDWFLYEWTLATLEGVCVYVCGRACARARLCLIDWEKVSDWLWECLNEWMNVSACCASLSVWANETVSESWWLDICLREGWD